MARVQQDLVAFEGACLRVALVRLHRRLHDATWTVNEDMLLMSQAPLAGPRHETIDVPGRTFLAAERRLTRLRQALRRLRQALRPCRLSLRLYVW